MVLCVFICFFVCVLVFYACRTVLYWYLWPASPLHQGLATPATCGRLACGTPGHSPGAGPVWACHPPGADPLVGLSLTWGWPSVGLPLTWGWPTSGLATHITETHPVMSGGEPVTPWNIPPITWLTTCSPANQTAGLTQDVQYPLYH